MIWFKCKQCEKVHSRPENSAGMMVFCECGQGNVVPWESTAPAQDSAPAAAPPPPPLRMEPELPSVLPRTQRRTLRECPDPAFCLNHETVASQHKCPDCGEAFCAECVLPFQDLTLCGPCKNYRVRRMLRPAQLSGLALASLLLALFTGPLVFCLFPIASSSGEPLLSLVSLLPQAAALVLGAMALRATESDAPRSGRSLAITGMVTATVAMALTLVATVFMNRPVG